MEAETKVHATVQEFLRSLNLSETYTVTYTLSQSHNLSRCIINCL